MKHIMRHSISVFIAAGFLGAMTVLHLLQPADLFASPRLGVATGTGIYAYTDPAALTDAYIDYFADTIVPADELNGGEEGFILGASGENVTIFSRYNPTYSDLYLLANTNGANLPLSFGGELFTEDTTDDDAFVTSQIDGYTFQPYSYLSLSSFADYWTKIFINGTKYFTLTASFEYGDTWQPGSYLFAVNDTRDIGHLSQKDAFSPKTTSATGGGGGSSIPEPATMLLFAPGVAAIFMRKKK